MSPLPLGSGFTRSQHGVIPVPPPATVELLAGFPVRPGDGTHELVTPTGAAIVAALARPGAPGEIVPRAVGYGAGTRELADRPNLLRVILGERAVAQARDTDRALDTASLLRDQMVVLEANIDDMNPELFDAAVEALFAAGARDVTLAPLTMKKGRPGTLLQVIAEPRLRDALAAVMLRETTTIGVRSHPVERLLLPRTERTVTTRFGAIRVKVATLPDGSERAAPEHDDCRSCRARARPAARDRLRGRAGGGTGGDGRALSGQAPRGRLHRRAGQDLVGFQPVSGSYFSIAGASAVFAPRSFSNTMPF